MGLIRAGIGSIGGVFADQWREFFYCDSLMESVLAVRGQKRRTRRSSNISGNDNIITSGSVISVADGQCALIVEQGKVIEICSEPGEFVFDASTEPSIFDGKLSKSVRPVFHNIGRRFTFGGEPPKDQRIIYFNIKELTDNRYGTASPIPFRIVDANIGLDMDITITCFGTFSYRITNPLLFYVNVCGNIDAPYMRERLDNQLEAELLTCLQPAFAEISRKGIRYSELPSKTEEIAQTLNELLSAKWKNLRGIEVVSFGIRGIKAKDEDEKMIKELQRNAAFRNPTMAAAQLVGAQSAAIQAAAANETVGPAMAFMGMNLAASIGGFKADQLYRMGLESDAINSPRSPLPKWKCKCGNDVDGNFCPLCGQKKPQSRESVGWTCVCGTFNQGAFCTGCGRKRAESTFIKCPQCGWKTIADASRDIHFCPNCGSPIKD